MINVFTKYLTRLHVFFFNLDNLLWHGRWSLFFISFYWHVNSIPLLHEEGKINVTTNHVSFKIIQNWNLYDGCVIWCPCSSILNIRISVECLNLPTKYHNWVTWTTEMYFLIVLEAGSLRSGWEPSLWHADCCPSHYVLTWQEESEREWDECKSKWARERHKLSDVSFNEDTDPVLLEKEMATHSSIFAWRIP